MKAPWHASAIGWTALLLLLANVIHGLAAPRLVRRKCPGLNCIAPIPTVEPLPDVTLVWRGESRSPAQLKQSGGFYARGIERLLKGEQLTPQQIQQGSTLLDHARGNPEPVTRFISTTTDVTIAAEKFVGRKGFVYLIQADEKMVDLHRTLGDKISPFPDQLEQAAVGHIPWKQIRGWFEIQDIKDFGRAKDGALAGSVPDDVRALLDTDPESHARFHKNPDFVASDWLGKKSSGIQPSLAGAKLSKNGDAVYNLDKFVRDKIAKPGPSQDIWDWTASEAVPLRETELGNWHKELGATEFRINNAKSTMLTARSSEDLARGAKTLQEALDSLTRLGRTMRDIVDKTPALSSIQIRWDELADQIHGTRLAMTKAKMRAHHREAESLLKAMESVDLGEASTSAGIKGQDGSSKVASAQAKIEQYASKVDAEVKAATTLMDETRQLRERLKTAAQNAHLPDASSARTLEAPGFIHLPSREGADVAVKRLLNTVQGELKLVRGADGIMEELRKEGQAILALSREKLGKVLGGGTSPGGKNEATKGTTTTEPKNVGESGPPTNKKPKMDVDVGWADEGFFQRWQNVVSDVRKARFKYAIAQFETSTGVVFAKGHDLGIDLTETILQTTAKNPDSHWTTDGLWDKWQKHLVEQRVLAESALEAALHSYQEAITSFESLYQAQGLRLVRDGKLGIDFAKTVELKPAGVQLSEAQLQDAWSKHFDRQTELSEILSDSPLCKRGVSTMCGMPMVPERPPPPHTPDSPSSASSARLAQRAQQLSTDEFARLVKNKGLGPLVDSKWSSSLEAARESVGYKPLTSAQIEHLTKSPKKMKLMPKVSTVFNVAAWTGGLGWTLGTNGDEHDVMAAILSFVPYTGCVAQFNADRHHGRASGLDYSACMIADKLSTTRLAPVAIVIHVTRFFVSLWQDAEPVPDTIAWQDVRDRSWRRLLQEKIYARTYVDDDSKAQEEPSFHAEVKEKMALNAMTVLSEGAKQIGLIKAMNESSSSLDAGIKTLLPKFADEATAAASMNAAIATLNRHLLLGLADKFNNETAAMAPKFLDSFYDSMTSDDVADNHKSSFLKRLVTLDVFTGLERDNVKAQLRRARDALGKIPLTMPPALEWPYILGQSSALAQLDDDTLSPTAWLREHRLPPAEIRFTLRVHESAIAKLVYSPSSAVRLPTQIKNLADQNVTTLQEFHALLAMKQGKAHDKDKKQEASYRWLDRQVRGKSLPGVQEYIKTPTTFESSVPKLDRSKEYDEIRQALVQALDREARLRESDEEMLEKTRVVPYHVVDGAVRTRHGSQRLY